MNNLSQRLNAIAYIAANLAESRSNSADDFQLMQSYDYLIRASLEAVQAQEMGLSFDGCPVVFETDF